MNLILFPRQALTYRLPPRDHRAIHIRKILKSCAGDLLRIGVINGPLGDALIETIDETGVFLRVEWRESVPASPEGKPSPVTVILGHPRPPVLKRLWRDLASMAVEEIRVFTGELGERSYLTSSIWNDPDRALLEGLSQGAHTSLPRLRRFESLDAALREAALWKAALGEAPPLVTGAGTPGRLRLFGTLDTGSRADDSRVKDLGENGPILTFRELLEMARGATAVEICIGPERGFTPREEGLLRENRFLPVSLGPRILRTETATLLLAGLACGAVAPVR